MTRRSALVVSIAAVLVCTAGWAIVASMSRVAMPASVWEVPATPTMGPVPGFTGVVATFNARPRPRDAPAGGEVDLGDIAWVAKADSREVAMIVLTNWTWMDYVRASLGGRLGQSVIGEYTPTDETRVVDGTTWRRFEWKPN